MATVAVYMGIEKGPDEENWDEAVKETGGKPIKSDGIEPTSPLVSSGIAVRPSMTLAL